ncbi:hypothetical protein [Baekduia sp. Peel2402]|uniref:hypothetical protein n=1 Tax=Baekduia sp. Peel2402 TaxID=3458296 RepID=UPI00403E5703
MRLRSVVLMAMLCVGAAAPAAGATTVDFESPAVADGTAVAAQFAASKGVTFVTGAPTGTPSGALPRMRVGGVVHGGTHALDVSNDQQEFAHPDFAGKFSTTRSTVSLYARATDVNVASVSLKAYNSAGAQIAIATHALTTAAGWVSFSVTTPGAVSTIAYFRLSSTSSGPVRVDDLAYDDPVTPPPADFAMELATTRVALSAGGIAHTTLTINRINGSNGDILLSDSSGSVGVTFSPNPVPAGQTTVDVAVSTASPADYDITLTGTPQSAGAGTEARTVGLTVASEFPLDISGPPDDGFVLPPCASLSDRLNVTRGAGNMAPITYTTNSAPAGVTAAFDPATTTLTLTRGDDTTAAGPGTVQVVGTADGYSTPGTENVRFTKTDPAIDAANTPAGAWTGAAPAAFAPGDTVTLSGSGFCPGSRVRFGNARAEVPATISAGGTRATAVIPALATSGPLTLTSPGGRSTVSATSFKITNYRHTNGFNFPNVGYDGDIGHWFDLYGVEQFFLQADPCALLTFGNAHCPVTTPIPNPLSYIVFAVADPALVGANGSCFGFALASRRIATGRGPTPRSLGGGTDVFSIPDSPAVMNYIWSQHVAQISSEYLAQWWQQSTGGNLSLSSATALRRRIETSIRSGSRPLISLAHGSTGHAVTAYDITDVQPSGAFTIRLYNSNAPFTDAEQGADGAAAAEAERFSVIQVAADGQWTFPEFDWHGGLANLVVLDDRTFPVRPRLPSSPEGILTMIFGAGAPSASAARAAAASTAADRLVRVPLLDDPTPAPVLVGDDGVAHDLPLTPGAGGKLDTLVAGGGNSGRVTGSGLSGATKLETGKGGDALGLEFGRASKLELALAIRPKDDVTRSLTAAFSGGLTGGASVSTSGPGAYEVRGGDGGAQLRLTLSGAGVGGAPQVFAGAPIRIPAGARVGVKPDWSRIGDGVTVTVRTRDGRRRTIHIKNTAHPAAKVSRVRVKATRKGRDLTVTVTARIGGKATTAVGAVGVAIRRGKTVVARQGTAARGAKLRKTVLKLRLPANAAKGTLTLQAAVATVGSGSKLSAGSSARGSATVG